MEHETYIEMLIDNFRIYYPTENVNGMKFEYDEHFNPHELIIHFPDGTTKVYDDMNKSIRVIYTDRTNISEDAWRREFVRRIKILMLRHSMTQEELANRLGISQPTLSGYLTGRNMPSFYFVTKLAKVLDCSPNDLYL